MTDLQNPRWIYLKGFLFLLILIAAATILLIEHPGWRTAALLALVIWSAARLYYFMFYVIERYVDPQFKFAGITAFLRYLWSRSKHHDD